MLKKRIIIFLILISITFSTVFSFSVSFASSEMTLVASKEMQTKNQFEKTVSILLLSVGDFFMEYLTYLLKEEVTIDKIIFNKVDVLNANFFEKSVNASRTESTFYIREIVNSWYSLLEKLATIVFLIALVAVGIMTMLRRTRGKGQSTRNTL